MSKDLRIIYSYDAEADLLALEKHIARRIVLKIEANASLANPLMRAKALTGILAGRYRYRIGDYRVIFTLDDGGRVCILKVLRVKHRKDVYRM